jgi:predicted AAA+ superfamily ATPase
MILQVLVVDASVVHRHLTEHLFQALADTQAILINGARRTGKSALAELPALKK